MSVNYKRLVSALELAERAGHTLVNNFNYILPAAVGCLIEYQLTISKIYETQLENYLTDCFTGNTDLSNILSVCSESEVSDHAYVFPYSAEKRRFNESDIHTLDRWPWVNTHGTPECIIGFKVDIDKDKIVKLNQLVSQRVLQRYFDTLQSVLKYSDGDVFCAFFDIHAGNKSHASKNEIEIDYCQQSIVLPNGKLHTLFKTSLNIKPLFHGFEVTIDPTNPSFNISTVTKYVPENITVALRHEVSLDFVINRFENFIELEDKQWGGKQRPVYPLDLGIVDVLLEVTKECDHPYFLKCYDRDGKQFKILVIINNTWHKIPMREKIGDILSDLDTVRVYSGLQLDYGDIGVAFIFDNDVKTLTYRSNVRMLPVWLISLLTELKEKYTGVK